MKTIETPRLILRGFCESDADDLFAILGDEQTCLDDGGYHAYESAGDPGFAADVKYLAQSQEHYAVAERESGRMIGFVHIMPAHRGVEARELGYVLNKDFRRRGYMTEAVRAVTGDLFASGVKMIVCTCYDYNTASVRTLESLGFAQEGRIRNSTNHPQRGVIDSLSWVLEKE
jgi:ribosomal-protein-alanine N-acetyltransferase